MNNDKKSILITGSSSGIGLAVAKDLSKLGWNVIASCRKEEDCKILKDKYGLYSTAIDYGNQKTILSGLEYTLDKTNGKIDVLFNNGAYGLPALVEDIPVDSLRGIFETNFFGWHSLTKEIIPHMKVNGSGRIIQNSSILGFMALKYRGAYTATKYAIEAMSDTLRLEIKNEKEGRRKWESVCLSVGVVAWSKRTDARTEFVVGTWYLLTLSY